jgi:tetratricopeptide (TPR) repeat protein
MNPAHYIRGTLLFQHKQYRLAAEQFRLQLGLAAGDSITHGMLALCLNALNEHSQASHHAREAIQLAPDHPFGYCALAQVLIGSNRSEEAFSPILEAIRLAPQHADYFGILSALQIDKGSFHEALGTAEQGLQTEPDNALCTNMRVLALAILGDRQAAAATMVQALAARPDHSHTHASQGWALLRLSRVPDALEHFREALRIDPELEWARNGMAEALKSRNFVYRRFLSRSNLAPMFNLLLRMDPFGRHLLTKDQVRGTYVTLFSVGAVLFCIVGAIAARSVLFAYLAFVFSLWSLVASAIYECRAVWHRSMITALTLCLLAVGLGLPLAMQLQRGNTIPPVVSLGACGFWFFWMTALARVATNKLLRASRPT